MNAAHAWNRLILGNHARVIICAYPTRMCAQADVPYYVFTYYSYFILYVLWDPGLHTRQILLLTDKEGMPKVAAPRQVAEPSRRSSKTFFVPEGFTQLSVQESIGAALQASERDRRDGRPSALADQPRARAAGAARRRRRGGLALCALLLDDHLATALPRLRVSRSLTLPIYRATSS